MVNGNTWPFLTVEKRRYRFRFLNGCQARFLILDFSDIPGVEVWQIGNEGGFLAAPVNLTAEHGNRLLMGLAERADVIVDFTNVPVGNYVLGNVGPDEPFGGGEPGVGLRPRRPGYDRSDHAVPRRARPWRADPTTPPQFLVLPAISRLPAPVRTRRLALLEEMSAVPGRPGRGHAGHRGRRPTAAAVHEACGWTRSPRTPTSGDTEVWEFYNLTADAHPMHVHEVAFEVVNRQGLVLDADEETRAAVQVAPVGCPTARAWESGFKDTVIAYPGEVTRIRRQFDTPGQFVWHCHIVEHEDNEMMRPYRIGPVQPGQPSR